MVFFCNDRLHFLTPAVEACISVISIVCDDPCGNRSVRCMLHFRRSLLRFAYHSVHPSVTSPGAKRDLGVVGGLDSRVRIGLQFRSASSDAEMKVLNVAEKNDAAKNIVRHLVGQFVQARNGPSKYNKNYDFQFNLFGRQCNMVMTSVSGHLLNYAFSQAYKSWQSCDPILLFRAPVHKKCPEDYVPVKRNLQQEVRGCQKLIIWTDCDREGEAIGFEIIEACREVNPNIDVYRAKFSDISRESIMRAMRTLERPDENQNAAVEVRSEIDLRTGAAFTRFLSLRFQSMFPQSVSDNLVSYGSCQFPTLGFVVERFKAHEDFQPEPFWKVRVFDAPGSEDAETKKTEFLWKRGKVFSFSAAEVFYDICVEANLAKVTSVTKKPTSKWRPVALDTVEMEKLGSWKLKINAKEMMRIAEKLYTSGYVSYPRTETNIFPPELNLGDLVTMLSGDQRWDAFAHNIMNTGGPKPRNGKKSDKAHPPIHPLKPGNELQGQDARVYEFICRHFLACCSRDARGVQTVVDVDLGGEFFSASGLIITDRGYLEVYPYDRWSDKELRNYEQGEEFVPAEIDLHEGATTAPPLLTEADLIALMEKHGIGTDATHAEHIETIKSRNYVQLTGRDARFMPGNLGLGLVEGYEAMGCFLNKPHLRAGLEADLKLICEGRKNPQDVLRDQVDKYEEVFRMGLAAVARLDEALERRLNERRARGGGGGGGGGNNGWPGGGGGGGPGPGPGGDDGGGGGPGGGLQPPPTPQHLGKCPKCPENLMLKRKKNSEGWMASCLGFPDCKVTVWFPNEIPNVRLADGGVPCPGCGLKKVVMEVPQGPFAVTGSETVTLCLTCDVQELDRFQIRPFPKRNGLTQQPPRPSSTWNAPPAPTQHPPPPPPPATSSPFANSRGFPDRSDFARMSAADAAASDIKCKCGNEAVLRTVRKEGPNTGRKFYTCQRIGGTDCDFFAWEENAASATSSGSQASRPNDSAVVNSTSSSGYGSSYSGGAGATSRPFNDSNSSRGRNNNGGPASSNSFNIDVEEGEVACDCNEKAKKLTVQKEGPNKGREFYVCEKRQGEPNRCNFFLWADVGPSTASSSSYSSSSWTSSSAENRQAPWASNSGGGAFGLSRGRGSRGGGRGSRGGGGGGRGRGGGSRGARGGAGTGGGGGARKCGVCGNTGHNRKNCPDRDHFQGGDDGGW